MSTPDALFCEDAERIVDELDAVRRQEASLAARNADLIDRLRRADIAHEELIVPRTRDQLRADALIDALLRSARPPSVADAADAAASLPGVQVNVSITVPALTLLGHGDEPAVLEGYGPIPLETANDLLVWTSPTGHEYATAGRDDRAPPA